MRRNYNSGNNGYDNGNNSYDNGYNGNNDDSFDDVTLEECPRCYGEGVCMSCDGTGRVGKYVCGECEGNKQCSRCGGDGEIEVY